jgi:2-iminobutanoate/2-iminopropanoate deaminase
MTHARFHIAAHLSDASGPYSHVVDCGDVVHVAGQIAADAPGWTLDGATIETETAMALRLVARLLETVGLDLSHVVAVTVHMTDLAELARMNAVYATFFAADRRPARTCVGVAGLIGGARIEITCTARRNAGPA